MKTFFTLEPVFENVFVVLPKMMKSFVSVQVFFEVRNWSFCFKWESPTVVYKSQFNFFPVRVSLSKTCFCAIVRKWWQPLLIFLQVVNFVVFPSRCGSLNLMWLKSFATDLEIVDQAHQITCQWCVCRSSSCSDRKVCGGSVSITSYFFNQWSVSVVIFFSVVYAVLERWKHLEAVRVSLPSKKSASYLLS